MSNASENKSQELLRKWLRDDTSEMERKRLQKEAEPDSFLAEAIEGYAQNKGSHQVDLDRMRAKLQTKYAPKKKNDKMLFYLTRGIAAAVILFAGIWGISQLNLSSSATMAESTGMKKESRVAAAEAPEDYAVNEENDKTMNSEAVVWNQAESEIEETEADGIVDMLDVADEVVEEKAAPITTTAPKPKQQVAPVVAAPKAPTPKKVMPPPAVKKETPAPAEYATTTKKNKDVPPFVEEVKEDADGMIANIETGEPMREEIADQVVISRDVGTVQMEKEETAPTTQNKAQMLTLNGTVLDQGNEGLPGASIQIRGTNFGTTTDMDGNFILESYVPMPWIVEVNYVGFKKQSKRITTVQDLSFRLYEDVSLAEVVVSSGEANKKSKAEMDSSAGSSPAPKTVAPLTGFAKYKKYIKENLDYPPKALVNNISGKVVLNFDVLNGRPRNIKVVEGLGNGCDEEAIRLIGTGPDWENYSTPVNVNYTIKFKN